jgi:hypothetical protein
VYKLARLSLEQNDAAGAVDGSSPRSGLSPPRVMAEPEVAEPPVLPQAPPPAVPCVVTWKHPGQSVFLTGDFNGWTQDSPMMRDGNEFWQVLNLNPGKTYHYKFVVDGEWMYAPDHSTARDARGNMSNYIQVEHWEPNVENDVLTVESPRNSYARSLPIDEDQYAKEPPPVPVHLMSKHASPAYMNDYAMAIGGGPGALDAAAAAAAAAGGGGGGDGGALPVGGAAGPPPVGGAGGDALAVGGTADFVSKDLIAGVSQSVALRASLRRSLARADRSSCCCFFPLEHSPCSSMCMHSSHLFVLSRDCCCVRLCTGAGGTVSCGVKSLLPGGSASEADCCGSRGAACAGDSRHDKI